MFAIFPSPAGMSLIKLSLDGNNLVSDIPAGDGKIVNLFLQCIDQILFPGNIAEQENQDDHQKHEGEMILAILRNKTLKVLYNENRGGWK
jgi:hypothetical protein